MSRRDDDLFDDEDDVSSELPRKSGSAFPMWLIVLLCAVPLGGVLLVAGVLAMFWARSAPVQQAEPAVVFMGPSDSMKRTYTRDEFKAKVGATPQEMTDEFGEPHIKLPAKNRTTWHYQNKTINPATGNVDSVVEVVFEGDVVVEVNF